MSARSPEALLKGKRKEKAMGTKRQICFECDEQTLVALGRLQYVLTRKTGQSWTKRKLLQTAIQWLGHSYFSASSNRAGLERFLGLNSEKSEN